uniref:Uncharacterized protein n=1 Tax=Bursaphelenchus xylophilus TaxID=6326 RepID=A0A1I7RVR0_BURXY
MEISMGKVDCPLSSWASIFLLDFPRPQKKYRMQNWVWISLLLAMIFSMVVCAQREEQHAANPLQRQNRAIITLGELLERTMWPEEM